MNKTIGQEKLCYDAPWMDVFEVSARSCMALSTATAGSENLEDSDGAWSYGGNSSEGYEETTGSWE